MTITKLAYLTLFLLYVTLAICERTFSKSNTIKSELRSFTKRPWLNNVELKDIRDVEKPKN